MNTYTCPSISPLSLSFLASLRCVSWFIIIFTNTWISRCTFDTLFIIIIIIINSLTARVVGVPQMILQPVFSNFPVLHCPLGLGELQACPFPDVVFPPLPPSALSSSPFHCASQDGFGQTWWTGNMYVFYSQLWKWTSGCGASDIGVGKGRGEGNVRERWS